MKLFLKNIGPFKESFLNVSDVTIIAGINDTGKSYLNKILFSVMKMLCMNIESDLFENFLKVTNSVSSLLKREIRINEHFFSKLLKSNKDSPLKEIYQNLRDLIDFLDEKNFLNRFEKLEFLEKNTSILKQFLKNYLFFLTDSQRKLNEIIEKLNFFLEDNKKMDKNTRSHLSELLESLTEVDRNFDKIKKELGIILKKEESYIDSLISNSIFNENFKNESIKNKNYLSEESNLILSSLEDEILNIVLNNKNDTQNEIKIKMNKKLNIYNDVTYIGDTFKIFDSIVDKKNFVQKRNRIENIFYTRLFFRYTTSNIFEFKNCNFEVDFDSKIQKENKNVLNEILWKEEIKLKFQEYFSLDYKINKTNDGFLNKKGSNISFFNSSKGLKIIQSFDQLIDTNIFSENNILIIDEPEAFLHPEWQYFFVKWLLYISASIKNFKLIISTHSPYVIDMVSSFSKREFKKLKFSYNFLYKDTINKEDSYIKNEKYPKNINDALNWPYMRLEDEEFEWESKTKTDIYI